MSTRPPFIGHYKDLLDADDARYPGSDELLSHGAPVGKKLGLTRIGVHIETIAPGRRTSWPHAESHEEEFAFVISGTPQVWIDGRLHDLVAGDFVAFPAGTGIAHTFLNNSNAHVVLLVGGDVWQEPNRVHYPLHPARNAEVAAKGRHWADCPPQDLGDHDGLPDRQRQKK